MQDIIKGGQAGSATSQSAIPKRGVASAACVFSECSA